MTDGTDSFLLPDLFTLCPFEASINPHHKQAAAESRAWVNRYVLNLQHHLVTNQHYLRDQLQCFHGARVYAVLYM